MYFHILIILDIFCKEVQTTTNYNILIILDIISKQDNTT